MQLFRLIAFGVNIVAITFYGDFCQAQTDRTLEPHAFGQDVADAAYNKIVNVFGGDHRFLIRLAWVESRFGQQPATFRDGYFGGIWQVDKAVFTSSQNTTLHPTLESRHKQIQDEFGIDWTSIRWEYLIKPLYSAIAARLFFLLKSEPIPTSIDDQGNYWKNYYRHDAEGASVDKFISDVKVFESCKSSKSKCRMALIVLLDGSGSIGISDFSKAKRFVLDLVKCISNGFTLFSFLVYSSNNQVIVPFQNNFSVAALEEKILSAAYPNAGTGTALAINKAMELLKGHGSTNKTSTVPNVMIVLTDGQSDSPDDTSKAGARAAANGIISYAVGIGSGYNYLELGKIAGSKKDQILTISSYTHLTDLLYQTRTKTCSKPLRPQRRTWVADFVHQNEISYFAFDMHKFGLTIYLNISEGDILGYYSYAEGTPTSALNDGILRKGQNFIPAPIIAIPIENQIRSRKMRSLTSTIQAQAQTGSTQILSGSRYGQVFVAIEGVWGMNNFTIYAEDGAGQICRSSAHYVNKDFLILPSIYSVLIYAVYNWG